jgi:hypothetical protein
VGALGWEWAGVLQVRLVVCPAWAGRQEAQGGIKGVGHPARGPATRGVVVQHASARPAAAGWVPGTDVHRFTPPPPPTHAPPSPPPPPAAHPGRCSCPRPSPTRQSLRRGSRTCTSSRATWCTPSTGPPRCSTTPSPWAARASSWWAAGAGAPMGPAERRRLGSGCWPVPCPAGVRWRLRRRRRLPGAAAPRGRASPLPCRSPTPTAASRRTTLQSCGRLSGWRARMGRPWGRSSRLGPRLRT